MDLPFSTHGAYPACDGKHVYVFEDSDRDHKNRFARVNIETYHCEVLPDVPESHMRYTSSCIQKNQFWKLCGMEGTLYCFDIATACWRSTKHNVGLALLVADMDNADRIWIVGTSNVCSYTISNNLVTMQWTGFIWKIPRNQAIAFIPTTSQGVICCVVNDGTSKIFDIETLSWHPFPESSQMKESSCTACYDAVKGKMWIQHKRTQFRVLSFEA